MKSFNIRSTFVAACFAILSACGGETAAPAIQAGESVQRSAQASVPRASASAELAYSTPTLIDGLAEEYRAAASERKVEAGDDGVPSYPQVPAHALTVVETYQPQRVGDEGN